jgi:hypothetical protein
MAPYPIEENMKILPNNLALMSGPHEAPERGLIRPKKWHQAAGKERPGVGRNPTGDKTPLQ